MISPMQIKAVFPKCRNPNVWCRALGKVVEEFDITTPARQAMWIAQCGYESSSFNTVREILSYQTVKRLRDVFPREFPTDEAAYKYVLNPFALGNFIYANRLGNGDVASGDGFKFRGGGLMQLTGRANYKGVGEGLGLDLEMRPAQIIIETTAARTAGFFWTQNDLNAAADAGDFDYTTERVNGKAMRGAKERREIWENILKQGVT